MVAYPHSARTVPGMTEKRSWKEQYKYTGARGKSGAALAQEFLTAVFDGQAPTEVRGKDDNRIYGDFRVPSGCTVEVKTQPITPWLPPCAEEAPATRVFENLYPQAWQYEKDGRTVAKREYPTNFVEFGVALLDENDYKPYHADWAERTAATFQVSLAQVHAARVYAMRDRRWYRLGDFEQVAVAFTSFAHAALVVYCEPATRSVVAYTGEELLGYLRRAFTVPEKYSFIRDAGNSSDGTVGMLNVPYGERRFQQKPDGSWRSLSPTGAPIGPQIRSILGYVPVPQTA